MRLHLLSYAAGVDPAIGVGSGLGATVPSEAAPWSAVGVTATAGVVRDEGVKTRSVGEAMATLPMLDTGTVMSWLDGEAGSVALATGVVTGAATVPVVVTPAAVVVAGPQ